MQMGYYSAIKRNKTMPSTATWMDLEIIIPSEVSQTKTDTACMWNLKMIQINLFTKQKQAHRHRKKLTKRKRGGEVYYEFGVHRYILLCVK